MGIDIAGLGVLGEVAGKLVDKFFPDKTQAQKDAAVLEMAQVMNEYNLQKAQTDINLEEAKSTNWFVAGWRPFTGWVCGVSLIYCSILEPMLRFAATIAGYKGTFPVIDTTITLQILLGLLGLAGMRTWEKNSNSEQRRT